MKKSVRILIVILCLATLLGSIGVFASDGSQGEWRTDADGKERYYVGGNFVTGVYQVGNHPYVFAADGECLGAYDAYVNMGTPGVMDTQAYKDALAAKNPYLYETFDVGRTLDGVEIPEGGLPLTHGNSLGGSFGSGIQTVRRGAVYGSVVKNGSDLAYTVYHNFEDVNKYLEGYSASSNSTHTYMHKSGLSGLSGSDFVVEFDLRLDNLPRTTISLISVYERGSMATDGFDGLDGEVLLQVNTSGYVFSPRLNNRLIAKVYGTESFTRISVAIHPAANNYDIYCNGVKVLSGLTLYDNATQDVADFRIEECRMFEIGSNATTPNTVKLVLDNMSFYNSVEPVCLSSETPRNGFMQDGAYLRYYENGCAVSGRHAVNGTFFGQTLTNAYTVFESGTGAAFIGYKATVTNGGVTVSSDYVDMNRFVAPKAVDMVGKHFIAWNVGGALVEPGYSTRIGSDLTADAMGVGFSAVNGAAMSTARGDSALIFAAKIAKADYDALVALGAKIEPHIITVPTVNVRDAHGYMTTEHLTIEGYEAPVDTVANAWLDQNDNYYFYGASIENIEDVTKDYSAIAYLKITLPNGTVIDIYADYTEENNSRNLYEVASAAYNDRTTVKTKGSYTKLVSSSGIRTYSPYKMGERNRIKDVVDKIIVLETTNKSVDVAGDYYNKPYDVTYTPNETGYDVTVESKKLGWKIDEIVGVMVDGEMLPAESVTTADKTCTFAVDSGKIYIYEKPVSVGIPEGSQTWVYVSATQDAASGIFTNTVQLPVSIDGELVEHSSYTSAFLWNFGANKNISPNLSTAITSMKTGQYYDLSGWQSMSFKVYVPESAVGATFYMIFYSNNSDTDGDDYYGKKITLSSHGWNDVVFNKSELGTSRTPLGWNKITSISFTTTGWEQDNDESTNLIVTDFIASDTMVTTASDDSLCDVITKDGAAMFTLDGYAGSIDGKTYKINPFNTEARVFKEGDIIYLPVNVFAVAQDRNAAYYEKSGIVTYEYDDEKYIFKAGNTYSVGGELKTLTYPAIARDGGVYISVDDAKVIYEYEDLFVDQMGLIVLSNSGIEYDPVADRDKVFSYIKELMYVRPSGDKIYSDMMAHSGGQHPYLLVDGEGFAELRYYAKYDETLQSYIEKYKNSYGIGSSSFRSQTQWFRRTDGTRLLEISRNVMNKMLAWGMLYQLGVYEGAEKQQLVDRVWAEAEAIANFYDDENSKYSWNPSHYLDTGEASYAMAIAYDWFYDEWTPEQRSQIAKAIYDYGLNTTSVLEGGGASYNLAGATNNWNGVTNGGIMIGSLAIVNDPYIVDMGLQDEVVSVLGASVKAVESGMWVYGPDGGYEEGPGYWSYGTTYCMVHFAAMNSACGTNYGLYYTPGFADSAYFTTYLGNANTTWGFHDGGSGDSNPSIAAWFASITGDGNLMAIRRQGIEKGWCGSSLYDIFFFNPHIINNSIDLTLDAYYSLDTIMTFRSSWDTTNNIFAGLHGGDNAAGHGDLDIGNFVINVNGVYMINDLGSDSYNMVGYFGAYRWSYYRKRTEGQNCLVMLGHGESWDGKTGRPECWIDAQGNTVDGPENAAYMLSGGKKYTITDDYKRGVSAGSVANTTPDPAYYGQKAKAIARATAFESGVNSAYGVVDMAPAYSAAKGQMLRGLYMKDNRTTVVLQDEGNFNAYQDIWWFAHSQGEITVSEDGRTAFIYRNGIYLYAEIVVDPNNPCNAKFSVMDWESLDTEYVGDTVESGVYTGETEYSRNGQKLVITATNTKVFNVAVVFKVVSSPAAAPEVGTTYAWTPIKDWKAE